jgi:hypothetical protein
MNDIKNNLSSFGLPKIPEELDETNLEKFNPDEVTFTHMEAAKDGELKDYDESKCKQYAKKYVPNVLVIIHTNGGFLPRQKPRMQDISLVLLPKAKEVHFRLIPTYCSGMLCLGKITILIPSTDM